MRNKMGAAILLIAIGLCGMQPAAQAATEVEPNNSCATAQSLGKFPAPKMKGEIVVGDSDFYLLKATPGSILTLAVLGAQDGKGTLQYPVVDAYDSACRYIGNEQNGSKTVSVPADGLLLIEVGDVYLSSLGDPNYLGSYVLEVQAPTSVIYGRLSDSQSGAPVPAAPVRLQRCPDPGYQLCTEYALGVSTDSSGHYAFDTSALTPGRYQLWVPAYSGNIASQYSAPLDLVGGESLPFDFTAQPTTIAVELLSFCPSHLPQGSDCDIVYRLTNTTAQVQDIDVRANVSIVTDAPVLNSAYDDAKSGSLTPIARTLQPGQTVKVTQTIATAAKLPSGSGGTIRLYVSKKAQPQSTIGGGYLGSFTVTTDNALSFRPGEAALPRALPEPAWKSGAAMPASL